MAGDEEKEASKVRLRSLMSGNQGGDGWLRSGARRRLTAANAVLFVGS